MTDREAFELSILTSRPDITPNLTPGSACMIRIEVDVDAHSDDDLMLDVGRPFLENLLVLALDRGLVGRIDLADTAFHSWRWPVLLCEAADIPESLAAIPKEADPTDGLYPVSIWLFERDAQEEAMTAVDAFAREVDSIDYWRRLIDIGVARATLAGSTLTLSCKCQHFDSYARDVRLSADRLGLRLKWLS